MLIKISKELEAKISHISKASKVNKDIIIQGIFDGFIDRYEQKKGKITPKIEKIETTDLWLMFTLFKKHYFEIYGQEYELDKKQTAIQLRWIKLTKEKILQAVMNESKSQIVAINEQDLVNSYEYILVKMPEWWKKNSFTPHSIYKNFEKILTQIKNGRKSGKDALDDFIVSISGN